MVIDLDVDIHSVGVYWAVGGYSLVIGGYSLVVGGYSLAVGVYSMEIHWGCCLSVRGWKGNINSVLDLHFLVFSLQ